MMIPSVTSGKEGAILVRYKYEVLLCISQVIYQLGKT